jgi:hypothetical protein
LSYAAKHVGTSIKATGALLLPPLSADTLAPRMVLWPARLNGSRAAARQRPLSPIDQWWDIADPPGCPAVPAVTKIAVS